MIDFHKIWIDQCDAARDIKAAFGTRALGYLIGEELLNFVQASDTRPEFAAELPNFVAEIKRTLQPREIREYVETICRVGAVGHVLTDKQFEIFRAAWRNRRRACVRGPERAPCGAH